MAAEHICLIHRSGAAVASWRRQWIERGHERGDVLVHIGDRPGAGDLFADERWLTPIDAYLVDGSLDISGRIRALGEDANGAIATGRSGIRMTGPADVARDVLGDDRSLVAFESALDRLGANAPVHGLGTYDAAAFSPSVLEEAAAAHRRVVVTDAASRATLDLRHEGDGVTVAGEIDRSTDGIVTSWLQAHLRPVPALVVDCVGVEFIDIAGLRAIARGGARQLSNPSPAMQLLLGVVEPGAFGLEVVS